MNLQWIMKMETSTHYIEMQQIFTYKLVNIYCLYIIQIQNLYQYTPHVGEYINLAFIVDSETGFQAKNIDNLLS